MLAYKLLDDEYLRWGIIEASSPEEAELKFKRNVSLTLAKGLRKKMAASRLSKKNFTVEEVKEGSKYYEIFALTKSLYNHIDPVS